MRSLIGIIIAFFFASSLQAQEPYLSKITDTVTVATYTYAQKKGQNLDLDIYTPAFDDEKGRPVFLYVHGGGFYTGIRNDEGAVAFCNKIARRGYVAVSISYRLLRQDTQTLFGCDCPVKDKLLAIGAAVEDLQDAVRFLAEKNADFGIDPNVVILCGSSAGAETVLSAVYNPYLYNVDSLSPRYAGVISLAGAIADTSGITNDLAIPSMFFHGTCDNIVPYGTAPHHYCPEGTDGYLVLYGTQSITEKLRELNKPFWLYIVCGEDHDISWRPMSDYFDEIVTFCYDFVLHRSEKQVHTVIPAPHECNYSDYNIVVNKSKD